MTTLYRSNSKGYDLNRNFPDVFKQNAKRTQPETDAVKDWISKIQFLLSGSLHGGALVWFYHFIIVALSSGRPKKIAIDSEFITPPHTDTHPKFIYLFRVGGLISVR